MTRAHFLSLGMTVEDAASRAALVDRVTSAFTNLVGARPDWRWFVPGRIEIFGKHTDYAGGRSLLAAVPRGFAVAARPRPDGLVRVVDAGDRSRRDIDPAEGKATAAGWGKYVQTVARRLHANFPGAPLGIDLVVQSDLPRAAGLSSSSALVVAVAAALARRADLPARPEWGMAIRSLDDLAWYLGCVENGLDYPGLPSTSGVGTHGGSEDQTAILACRTEHVSQYRFVPVASLGQTLMPAHWTFVIASSGVRADKAGSVREHYNRASLGTRALLECWNAAAAAPASSLGSALQSADALARLQTLAAETPCGGFTAEALLRRLAHFVAEDARVPEAADAFASADAAALGRLSADSQKDADAWLGNQIPETRALAAEARTCGALAATSFGAGFGGSVWALVQIADAARFRADWMAAYARRHPTVSGVESFIARPGPALTEVPPER